ncbi:MAG: glycosyltransferase family 2 protein [Lachnospiraceae bacterium]|nr:glycosyltransferase family 2 protein [Lachnospiraceae bacterium]
MLVSVIIPAYNAGRTIEKCLKSIVNQTYSELQIIVVNDGSEDDTEAVVTNMAAADSRIICISQKNGGLCKARNAGLDAATGEFVAFVDADDYIEPDMIEEMYKAYDGKPAMICGKYYRENKNGGGYGHSEARLCVGFVWGKLFSNSIISDYGVRFDERIALEEDVLFVLEYMDICRNYVIVDSALYHYVMMHKSLSSKYVPCVELVERLISDKARQVRAHSPEFMKHFPQRNNEMVVMVMKVEYNDCASDSPVTRSERIQKLKTYLRDERFLRELKEKPQVRMEKVFVYLMRLRLVGLLDLIFMLIKRSK